MNILENILAVFRTRKIKKFLSDVPTGFIPLDKIANVNVVIDVEEPGFDLLKEDILAWGRQNGRKVNIYFFVFRKLGKDELLLTSIQTTIIKKELDWLGTPNVEKISSLMEEKSDLFISLVDNGNFPIEFMSKCVRARFKVGRCPFPGHAYDMVVTGTSAVDLRSDSRQIFAEFTEFIQKVK